MERIHSKSKRLAIGEECQSRLVSREADVIFKDTARLIRGVEAAE